MCGLALRGIQHPTIGVYTETQHSISERQPLIQFNPMQKQRFTPVVFQTGVYKYFSGLSGAKYVYISTSPAPEKCA